MSASQDKKRRTDERALGTERRQVASQKEAKERKQSKIKWTVGSIIVVLLVAAILIGNSSLFYTARPALQVGDVKYSSAEVNYAYRSAYLTFCNQYGSYLSYVGLDTSKALDEQECRISDDFDTWDDYFKDAAEKNLVQVTALCDAAQKAGVTLDEDDQHEIDEQFSYLELTAKQYKYNSVSKYLQAAYGNGVTKKVVRHMLERSELATKYSQQQYDSYTYTPEEIAASYAENKNSCDTFNYQYYFVQADTEDSTDDDGNATSKTTDATMAAAKATADKIAAATHDAESFTAAVTANVPAKTSEDGTSTAPSVTDNADTKGSNFSSAVYADWLYSADRTANDVTVVEQENSGYYVVLFESRDDNAYNTVNVRHILIKAEDSDGDGTYSDEEKQKAKARSTMFTPAGSRATRPRTTSRSWPTPSARTAARTRRAACTRTSTRARWCRSSTISASIPRASRAMWASSLTRAIPTAAITLCITSARASATATTLAIRRCARMISTPGRTRSLMAGPAPSSRA